MSEEGLQKAIAAAGSQTALAAKVGKRQSNVWRWIKAGRVPGELVIPMEAALDGKVTRHELRPDLYPLSGKAAE